VKDREVVVGGERQNVVESQAAGGGIHESASRHERRRLREPRRVPERPHFAARLIPGPGSAVESFVGRGIEKERALPANRSRLRSKHGMGHEFTSRGIPHSKAA
jgi:hypothetical protein